MQITLQGKEITTIEDFHKVVKRDLQLPDYYGNNLDALWECLTGWVATPLTIIWLDLEESKAMLGPAINRIVDTFNDAEKKVEGFKIEYR